MTSTIPTPQKSILDSVLKKAEADPRLTAILAGGSLLHGGFDEHSDLDLVLVANPEDYASVMQGRRAFAESCGDLLAAFTGEHVGEPRLLICLFGPDAIHVDLKFVTPDALDNLIELPEILWTRDDGLEARLSAANVAWPNQPAEWFEERFWIWVHYAATKIARGELFEAMGMLSFIREQVLGPLIHTAEGRPQRGVRRIEAQSPTSIDALEATVASHTRGSVLEALKACIVLYEQLTQAYEAKAPLRARVSRFVSDLA